MSKLFLRLGIALFVCLQVVFGEEIPNALELQRRALDKQREAVRKQVGSTENASNSFFTTGSPPAGITPVSAVSTVQADCEPLPDSQVDRLVKESAQKHQVSANLVRAVMQRESGFKPCAVSPKGAQGLMQLMPATAQQFGVSDPFDPAQNVTGGVELLKQLLGRYKGDIRLALSAYNAGTAVVDKIKDIPDIPETQAYVSAIVGSIQ